MIGLSLFSNIGIAEMGLNPKRFKILYANEIDKKRSALYQEIHSLTKMMNGDIRNSYIKSKLIENREIDFIISSPHPSPFSAYNGFFGSKPFSKANSYLIKNGIQEIKW